jgi:hypothetical protein
MKQKELLPIFLDIESDEPAELNANLKEAFEKPQFTEMIKTTVYEMLKVAVEDKLAQFPLFRLPAYDIDYIVEKSQYKNLLNKILSLYQKEEDYLKCAEIKKVIELL